MINLAKQFNNDPEMIRLAQIFVQQPRNSPDQAQIPYCQVAPKNPELNGLFHCQFLDLISVNFPETRPECATRSSAPPLVTSTAAAQASAPVDVAAPSSTPVISSVEKATIITAVQAQLLWPE
ncbi:hypothetical protein BJ912DRAFT_976040 [Pholiota molesta]|nr:hypothetical protein BJ912DRAFT_976040 [Pholiota molesta]